MVHTRHPLVLSLIGCAGVGMMVSVLCLHEALSDQKEECEDNKMSCHRPAFRSEKMRTRNNSKRLSTFGPQPLAKPRTIRVGQTQSSSPSESGLVSTSDTNATG